MDTIIYDVTSADSAYEWVLKFLDISGDELIDKYILEFDSNNDAFIESQLKKIKIWDIENTNFVVIHVTTNKDECMEIKQSGIMNLQRVVTEDTEFKRFLSSNRIQFDIDNALMVVGDAKYNVDYDYYKNIPSYQMTEQDKNLKEIARKLYYDPQINGFFYVEDVKRYGSNIHERPEFLYNISQLSAQLKNLEKKWGNACVGYEIKYKAKFNEFAWYSFYENKDEFYEDMQIDRINLKKELLSNALNIAFSKMSSYGYEYMKLETTIPNEQILKHTKIN